MSQFGHDEVRRIFLKRLLEVSSAATVASLFPSRLLAAGVGSVVHGVDIAPSSDGAQVVFELSAAADHHIFVLSNPDRVVIDFNGTQLNASLKAAAARSGLVKNVRYARRNGDDLRVVLDLTHSARASATMLQPAGGNPRYRLVLDLNAGGAAVASRPQQPEHAVKSVDDLRRQLRDVVVVIDPGHGGKDPGAVGRGGTYEKHVVLAMGRHLHELLNSEKGVRAVMTRDRDVFLPLAERVRIAHHHKADLFLSIHADASTDRSVTGSSVYILSEHGASSVMARQLAERENRADLVGGVKLSDKDNVLASVLLDLSQTATLQASSHLAADMMKRLDPVAGTLSDRVERAGFAVLKSPDIPSALVETAFISNPAEERKLRSSDFQQRMAQAMHQGILSYFSAYAPPGTALAEMNTKQFTG